MTITALSAEPGSEAGALVQIEALAHPQRLRILASLSETGPDYVSALARRLGISRPLLHLHLRKLETARLVSSRLEISDEGKALRIYTACRFRLVLDPAAVVLMASSLPADGPTEEGGKST